MFTQKEKTYIGYFKPLCGMRIMDEAEVDEKVNPFTVQLPNDCCGYCFFKRSISVSESGQEFIGVRKDISHRYVQGTMVSEANIEKYCRNRHELSHFRQILKKQYIIGTVLTPNGDVTFLESGDILIPA